MDLSFTPNPNDPDEIELFKWQQQFICSICSKMLVEGKATDVLQECLDPYNKMKFGDAQKICADLCDFHEGSAMTWVNTATLESPLTNVHLNKTWTKTASAFLTAVSHLIRDHKKATQGICVDDHCIKKLNAMFFEHKNIESHIQTIETQDNVLSRCLEMKIAPCACEDHSHTLSDCATLLLDN